ncbi:hypothetical protein BU25DRAFT_334303 [Macroventuria anomochaeta]|uniref:Uncharacterized protein n=1 Tax=Macroventuria anomochaeta TaxID=301207 RepID=A0ACB6S998_9PLEO|nr:uncharacterized protein BU25DRAFT_334303 [Macroventuria anomochaeta]KAF2630634.1 hypothetical protein BU25DRAFT_334303 [Macroventuria anomochaeta]
MPQYLVRPTIYRKDYESLFGPVKIIDFGQSFMSHDTPDEFHNPVPLRPPEVIFKDKADNRMDLWSMGCMVPYRVTTPFDPYFESQISSLGNQMLEHTGDRMPDRWQKEWQVMDTARRVELEKWYVEIATPPFEEPLHTLQTWLENIHLDEERKQDLSRNDIQQVGELVRGILRLEPTARASARDIVQDPWFHED